MSFILDALRKSEHERSRAASPSVAQIPYALPRARLPFWVPVAIGVLGAALAATGFAWWYTTRPAADGGQRLAASATAPTPPASAPPAEPRMPRTAVDNAPTGPVPQQQAGGSPAWANPPRSGDPPPWSPETPELRAQVTPSGARLDDTATRSAVGRTVTPEPAVADAALPTASALAAAGVVPPLTLHVLVFSDDAAKRFAIINNRRYAEGAFLAEGPQLVRISNRGAVLRQQGRDFLLLPE